MVDFVPIRRALLSVSDKTGLKELADILVAQDIEMISTGGTAQALRKAGHTVRDVSEITGQPEMMDGRVKTLHPFIHGGLLARRDTPDHLEAMKAHSIDPIDLLVVNLYPFEHTVNAGGTYEACIENIDIGGPAMLRSAAKNHAFVTVLTDIQDYEAFQTQLKQTGGTTYAYRQKMAEICFARTAAYDAAVSVWMAESIGTKTPRRITVSGELKQTLRYGENPHQQAAFYTDRSAPIGLATATQHQGKALSYNNINDTNTALTLMEDLNSEGAAACVIVKHANPCGVACGENLRDAYQKAFDCDRTSAFGGIIAVNVELDAATAMAITEIFTEVVIAPSVTQDALDILSQKQNVRLLTTGGLAHLSNSSVALRQVTGGWLRQDKDTGALLQNSLKVVTQRKPTDAEMCDLLFAWTVAKHVSSNAIVYAKDRATVGIGAGQMSRVDSAMIAAKKAERMAQTLGLSERAIRGAAVASDAFFPFADGLLQAIEAGATCVIQPGGSLRDAEVIAAADDANVAMIFTGMRHFRH